MKLVAVLVAAMAIVTGLTIDATSAGAGVLQVESCNTPEQAHEQDVLHLSWLARHGYKLTQHARLVQAGVALKGGAHLMAVPTRTLALQPPHNEDPGSGGGGFYAIPAGGLYLSGMFFANSIKIVMNCWAGGSAWTGAPPGDLQSGIAVHKDGGVSNITFAYCPAVAYGNCLFNWEANDVGYGVAFLWVGGKYTEPMYLDGWTVCHG